MWAPTIVNPASLAALMTETHLSISALTSVPAAPIPFILVPVVTISVLYSSALRLSAFKLLSFTDVSPA
ncbi:hypothetical protein DSECCO2_463530 [anaerobic digester metagenome]